MSKTNECWIVKYGRGRERIWVCNTRADVGRFIRGHFLRLGYEFREPLDKQFVRQFVEGHRFEIEFHIVDRSGKLSPSGFFVTVRRGFRADCMVSRS